MLDVRNLTKRQILEAFLKRDFHETLANDQYSAALMVKSAEDIENSVDTLSKEISTLNSNLGKLGNESGKLTWWLIAWTAIIAVATVVNVFAAAHWKPFN